MDGSTNHVTSLRTWAFGSFDCVAVAPGWVHLLIGRGIVILHNRITVLSRVRCLLAKIYQERSK
jgi:hypothetical protein